MHRSKKQSKHIEDIFKFEAIFSPEELLRLTTLYQEDFLLLKQIIETLKPDAENQFVNTPSSVFGYFSRARLERTDLLALLLGLQMLAQANRLNTMALTLIMPPDYSPLCEFTPLLADSLSSLQELRHNESKAEVKTIEKQGFWKHKRASSTNKSISKELIKPLSIPEIVQQYLQTFPNSIEDIDSEEKNSLTHQFKNSLSKNDFKNLICPADEFSTDILNYHLLQFASSALDQAQKNIIFIALAIETTLYRADNSKESVDEVVSVKNKVGFEVLAPLLWDTLRHDQQNFIIKRFFTGMDNHRGSDAIPNKAYVHKQFLQLLSPDQIELVSILILTIKTQEAYRIAAFYWSAFNLDQQNMLLEKATSNHLASLAKAKDADYQLTQEQSIKMINRLIHNILQLNAPADDDKPDEKAIDSILETVSALTVQGRFATTADASTNGANIWGHITPFRRDLLIYLLMEPAFSENVDHLETKEQPPFNTFKIFKYYLAPGLWDFLSHNQQQILFGELILMTERAPANALLLCNNLQNLVGQLNSSQRQLLYQHSLTGLEEKNLDNERIKKLLIITQHNPSYNTHLDKNIYDVLMDSEKIGKHALIPFLPFVWHAWNSAQQTKVVVLLSSHPDQFLARKQTRADFISICNDIKMTPDDRKTLLTSCLTELVSVKKLEPSVLHSLNIQQHEMTQFLNALNESESETYVQIYLSWLKQHLSSSKPGENIFGCLNIIPYLKEKDLDNDLLTHYGNMLAYKGLDMRLALITKQFTELANRATNPAEFLNKLVPEFLKQIESANEMAITKITAAFMDHVTDFATLRYVYGSFCDAYTSAKTPEVQFKTLRITTFLGLNFEKEHLLHHQLTNPAHATVLPEPVVDIIKQYLRK